MRISDWSSDVCSSDRTALYGERHPAVLARHWRHVYALSLAVHCTSWSFYGTVTQATRYGWPLPPTFIGAIAFYVLAVGFMVRLRSEERRVGQEVVGTVSSWWWPDYKKKNKNNI